MRVAWYIIISAIFVMAGYCSGGAKIEFDETEFDFGELNQNYEASHIFKFKNTGDDTLIIKNVRAP